MVKQMENLSLFLWNYKNALWMYISTTQHMNYKSCSFIVALGNLEWTVKVETLDNIYQQHLLAFNNFWLISSLALKKAKK